MFIDGVLVVEGKTDKSYLSTFIFSEIVSINGLEVSPSDIVYLKERNKTQKIYILTDPDHAGEAIRNKLNTSLVNVINLFVDKKDCDKHQKHGVAECKKETLIKLLSPYKIAPSDLKNEQITTNDLYLLGLIGDNSIAKRKNLCQKLNLGHCSAKEMLKRINHLGLSLATIKKEL